MKSRVHVKNPHREQQIFLARVVLAAMIAAVLLLCVVGRLFYLQVIQYSYYTDLAQGNRVRDDPLPPDRGLIYDRQGAVVAENTPAYTLELTPEQVSDVPDTLTRLSAIGLIEAEQIPSLTRVIKAGHKFEAVPLRLSLTDTDIATFAVRQHEFPGVEIQTRLARWYPFGASSVHALGYVGIISDEDLKHIDRDEYSGPALIGKAGIEAAYEAELHGQAGFREVLVNAQGRHVDHLGNETIQLDTKPPRAGNDVMLSLDMRLQHIAETMLAGKRGAVAAIDPNTGDVLALVSVPTFDPNKFTRGISRTEYAQLRDDPDRPLFNRALKGTYPPGSTVKPFMALAGLEYNVIDPQATRYCHGAFTLAGASHVFHDWKPEGHGQVDMRRAIATSCDVYFYGLAETLGIDRIHASLSQMGFGALTGIDISGERPALLPSPEWKQQTYKQAWYPGETINVGIGQGYMLVTPLQLAHAAGVVALKGKRFQPRLVTAIRDATTRAVKAIAPVELPGVSLSDAHNWDVVIDGMEQVMQPGGTGATAARGAPYRMAGKSGTAQVFTLGEGQKYNAARVAERLRDHAWFIAFAPVDNPKIAIAVLVENGGHGGSASAPIVRRLFDAYLLGKYDESPPLVVEPPSEPLER
jgi:penicillin-binding protein 2